MTTQKLLLLLAVSTSIAAAQVSVKTDFSAMSDDNVDNNYLKTTDHVSVPSLGLTYDWSDDLQEAGVFYTGALNYYSDNTARTFLNHQAGIAYTRLFGSESETTLETKLSYGSRIGREDFSVFDYNQWFASAGTKHYFTETMMGQALYTFHTIAFHEMGDFNYSEHILSLKFSTYLSTQTAIILNMDVGGKYYSSITDSSSSSGSLSRGKGGSSQTLPSVIQAAGSIRVGQSIWEGTGISVLAQYQTNLRKQTRYFSSEYGLMSDDEVFDDHYGYEGLLASAMLTQALPFKARLRFILGRQDRLYSNLPAYDLAGNVRADQRSDIRSTFTVDLTKSMESLGLDLTFTYDYIVNTSNDPFYDYVNNALTVNLSFGL
jgi:hypothetical protein